MAEEKAGLLAQPDVFISAVGTRIYNYDSDGEWEEDAAWTVPLTQTQPRMHPSSSSRVSASLSSGAVRVRA